MAKQLMSFRFDDSIAEYLKIAVKNSSMSMTEYIEMLVEIDMDSKTNIEWDKGCVITSDDRLIVIDRPYYMTQIDLLESGVGIIAAIPDTLIPLSTCLSLAIEQARKDEDICYWDENKIHSIDLNDAKYFSEHLSKLFCVDVKAGILG